MTMMKVTPTVAAVLTSLMTTALAEADITSQPATSQSGLFAFLSR